MKKTDSFLLLFLAAAFTTKAQTIITGDWEAQPGMHTVAPDFATAESVILEEDVKLEYKEEQGNLWVYRTTHRLVKVLDEKGIETFNKMNIPTYEGVELKTLKARTVLPNGKIFEITKDKMKSSKGDDGSSEIVFAMEGVEKNAEIELIVCEKKHFSLFGTETFQYSVPVMHALFEIVSPKRLVYEEKGYNGFPTVKDTLIDKVRYISASASMIPGLKSEAYSFYDANRMRAEYKISYLPEEHENVRQFTWIDLAKQIYENSYQLTDRETKAVTKFMETLGVNQNDNELYKIKKIENGIKTNISLYKELPDDNSGRLDYVIAKKSATESGFIRLFAACFVQAGVKHELGIASDRSVHPFDNDFENWNIMEYYLFYFPNLKNFTYPAGVYDRYPFVPSSLLTNKGVFLKLVTIGDVTNAVADIRTITPMPTAESQNNIAATITFSPEMEALVDATYSFSGYTAMGVREAVQLLPKEQQKDLAVNIASVADGKADNLVQYATANESFDSYYDNKPLELKATVKAPQLVEKAGSKYLLKIGDVIGRQSEMYQNTTRKLPIDFDYPHYLNRTITVVLPAGYKILNPETIKINADIKGADGKATTAFYSDYKVEGNKLTVTISEFYSQLHFPVSDYESFRKVVNASADFNKVNLLIAKD